MGEGGSGEGRREGGIDGDDRGGCVWKERRENCGIREGGDASVAQELPRTVATKAMMALFEGCLYLYFGWRHCLWKGFSKNHDTDKTPNTLIQNMQNCSSLSPYVGLISPHYCILATQSSTFSLLRPLPRPNKLPPRHPKSHPRRPLVLAIPAQVSVLMHVPRSLPFLQLSPLPDSPCCCVFGGFLGLFPFLLTLAIELHLPRQEGGGIGKGGFADGGG